MIAQLTTLYQNQEKTKIQWKKLKNNYFKIIYRDILEHKTANEIHKNLIDSTINGNKMLLAYAMKVATKAKKLDKGAGAYYGDNGLDVLAIALVNMFSIDAVNYKANKIINRELVENESKEKNKILDWSWKEGRKTGNIFYVASSHKDSAKDHKDWQGKIYVDRYWHNYDTDGSMAEYIRKNDIKTVQWVTGKPVYFITRPYCRHYFREYSWDEISKNKYHIPKKKEGDRRLQTPAHANLEYYQDRLKELQALASVRMTPLLRDKIAKTKVLISRWKQQLKISY